ncbi:MAG: hypothetical protein QOK37_3972 [Thermoanaerobaculia bacterium]|jgi:hypothetical protein|nr:hypothetical protein [Thermoanaerobaculia bacterium]
MIEQILPRSIDNNYRGHKAALWIFGLLALMRLTIGVNSIINGHDVLMKADGVPLDTYPVAAAQTIVALWALLGLSYIFIGVLSVVVLVRYRSMVPFLFLLLLLQHLGGRVILQYLPIIRTGAPPASAINLIFLTMIVLGLALSLWRRR